jgi:hypothetical protein
MRRLFSLSIGVTWDLPFEADRTDWRNGFAAWHPSISRKTADMAAAAAAAGVG